MCEICMKEPCDPRCPNAEEEKKVHICCECFKGIYAGEKCYEGSVGFICKECLDDMDVEEILELVGESLQTA